MAAVATPSEIQIILRLTTEYQFISDMIPIAQDTCDRYFGTDFDGSYPVALKRPVATMIQLMMENPGMVWRKEVGDDETEYRTNVTLDSIFAGLDDLIANDSSSGIQVINLRSINADLGY